MGACAAPGIRLQPDMPLRQLRWAGHDCRSEIGSNARIGRGGEARQPVQTQRFSSKARMGRHDLLREIGRGRRNFSPQARCHKAGARCTQCSRAPSAWSIRPAASPATPPQARPRRSALPAGAASASSSGPIANGWARRFRSISGQGLISPAAIADPPVFRRARAVCRFDGTARELVHRLKYGDRLELALTLGRMMVQAGAELLPQADLIVPVPLHRTRLWRRRFNQAAALAQVVVGARRPPAIGGRAGAAQAHPPAGGADPRPARREPAGSLHRPGATVARWSRAAPFCWSTTC